MLLQLCTSAKTRKEPKKYNFWLLHLLFMKIRIEKIFSKNRPKFLNLVYASMYVLSRKSVFLDKTMDKTWKKMNSKNEIQSTQLELTDTTV